MIDVYYWTTPNGHKITIFLEEAGLPYRIVPVNISKGDQFKPEFLAISPNNRIPAIVDHNPLDGGTRFRSPQALKSAQLCLEESFDLIWPELYRHGSLHEKRSRRHAR